MPPGIADVTEGREPPLVTRPIPKPSRKETIMSLVELLLEDDGNLKGRLRAHYRNVYLAYTRESQTDYKKPRIQEIAVSISFVDDFASICLFSDSCGRRRKNWRRGIPKVSKVS
jgi:hypothetical protein